MIYKETTESRELFVYTVNNSRIYPHILANIKRLNKKYNKGIYDSNKAIDAWYYIATFASDEYNKDFGYSFSVQDRFSASVNLEEYFKEDIEE